MIAFLQVIRASAYVSHTSCVTSDYQISRTFVSVCWVAFSDRERGCRRRYARARVCVCVCVCVCVWLGYNTLHSDLGREGGGGDGGGGGGEGQSDKMPIKDIGMIRTVCVCGLCVYYI